MLVVSCAGLITPYLFFHKNNLNMDLQKFSEDKINYYAQMIIDGHDRADELALGELHFYMSLRRVLIGKATKQDTGLMDAINDVLQEKGIVEKGKTFYH